MTDCLNQWLQQDQDGSHIKGLLINFIHHNWPSLLRHNFIEEFITPIIKVSFVSAEMCFAENVLLLLLKHFFMVVDKHFA